jgi:hypothetical protein
MTEEKIRAHEATVLMLMEIVERITQELDDTKLIVRVTLAYSYYKDLKVRMILTSDQEGDLDMRYDSLLKVMEQYIEVQDPDIRKRINGLAHDIKNYYQSLCPDDLGVEVVQDVTPEKKEFYFKVMSLR